ncbi:MAG: 50S ribosomal protein L28 [uncultured bacterium]|nr:MAG: 50S ribosomal protein L28 [uncultured bacterium]OGT15965.1 MAG: 50S ribosomal protein L28 [Gammaproteobacteria bacterium RIFCSPHIGHO2_02_FULL_38_33]OGT24710.1 MAG: 50S ribosomal protein L28 [Gammaproteobacteria bacterium RIFCSPHIGHO2_12_38_15]OGT67222.1 MAG: 50S ribosomal protein L28 [Gammaproteobacteria bacterium RIFCSPLOWO2_02_FULL_38_11]OGT75848.1 MAG: 50S ribosomal protein L28 [Gammaproteobacteria bacterium RIFCSPLOWO2_12_FULL_38_14]
MSKVCQVTGKKPLVGNNVSHANNKTKRRYFPNLKTQRIYNPTTQKYETLRLTTRGLKTIDKYGIEYVLKHFVNSKKTNSNTQHIAKKDN